MTAPRYALLVAALAGGLLLSIAAGAGGHPVAAWLWRDVLGVLP